MKVCRKWALFREEVSRVDGLPVMRVVSCCGCCIYTFELLRKWSDPSANVAGLN